LVIKGGEVRSPLLPTKVKEQKKIRKILTEARMALYLTLASGDNFSI